VSVHVGTTVHIVLDAGFTWGTPSTTSTVVRIVSSSQPTSGGLQADVLAVRPGAATVSDSGGVACPPGQPCPALARVWAVHITVLP
jgi:hypothetical protein